MANIKSKIKSIKTMEKARKRNSMIKSRVKTSIKKAKLAITQDSDNAKKLVSDAHHEIHKAKSKGVFHKNTALRKSSRLDLFFNKHMKSA
ncbi:30S ribosomal protein S20 [Mycoplasmopsis pulmonis]|uniref:Small ribosomal subunit protein bS20 n=1 Tax=Mycoplasmopsis pulmonis (strain UAB CTIP) TaxID=272635 RepID=RS20_MYCPU|nr:30S ribosomal protein S20 [Mycoplasmopsis pulmonis]Q98PR3.2 RecName: Full=Small ribosomal subunit protein bS20; AltName: Full=30S ribosomal protein S20 [Mycoplasmopsis pulmonis UAB CTIP]MDZ7293676.1 30S ribosomal protein S20 [Mycoplasmopsis pulmonis]VEU68422.1 30S ribosomal protein S20 [Mycoplasmopsis pulmonis]